MNVEEEWFNAPLPLRPSSAVVCKIALCTNDLKYSVYVEEKSHTAPPHGKCLERASIETCSHCWMVHNKESKTEHFCKRNGSQRYELPRLRSGLKNASRTLAKGVFAPAITRLPPGRYHKCVRFFSTCPESNIELCTIWMLKGGRVNRLSHWYSDNNVTSDVVVVIFICLYS